MRVITLLFLLNFSLTSLVAQNTLLKAVDSYTDMVHRKIGSNLLVKNTPDKNSVLGGSLTAYYQKNKLVLITSHHGGEFGYIDYSYYVQNDSLLFVKEIKVILKEPETEKEYSDYEKYVLFNTDKTGKTDFKKWPLTIDIENDFYWQHDKIIKYQLENFNKPLKATESEMDDHTKNILYRFAKHLEELN